MNDPTFPVKRLQQSFVSDVRYVAWILVLKV